MAATDAMAFDLVYFCGLGEAFCRTRQAISRIYEAFRRLHTIPLTSGCGKRAIDKVVTPFFAKTERRYGWSSASAALGLLVLVDDKERVNKI